MLRQSKAPIRSYLQQIFHFFMGRVPKSTHLSRASGRSIVPHRHRREMGVVGVEQQRRDDLLASRQHGMVNFVTLY